MSAGGRGGLRLLEVEVSDGDSVRRKAVWRRAEVGSGVRWRKVLWHLLQATTADKGEQGVAWAAHGGMGDTWRDGRSAKQ
jgi:hypothetical protein